MELTQALQVLKIEQEVIQSGLTMIAGKELLSRFTPPFPSTLPALILLSGAVSDDNDLSKIKAILNINYPPEHQLSIVKNGKVDVHAISLKELDDYDAVSAIYVPAHNRYSSIEAFQEIVAKLRAPDGCPWDREQTHESLRPFILEESYEMVDAIDESDLQGMTEELGDVLLQILLHAQVGVEADEFRLGDVIQAICEKMVRRHPHVFSTVNVGGDVSKVLRNWQEIKEEERKTNGVAHEKGILDGVPNSMSSLLQAQSYQGRAACVGFDWDSIDGVLEKVEEEIAEIRSAKTPEDRAGEIGDLLFALVNLSRWLGLDAESTLRKTNVKFRNRFAYVEKRTRESGQKLTRMSLEEMDKFWDEAKQNGI